MGIWVFGVFFKCFQTQGDLTEIEIFTASGRTEC